MKDFTQGAFGYAIDRENVEYLDTHGTDAELVLTQYRSAFPKWNEQANPLGIHAIRNQGPVGACQGFSLSAIFGVCYFLATGRREVFSAAAAYYLSQRFDGIRGDQGSTLSGGQKVATQHGLCLEKDWPYVPRYNPQQPSGIQFPFKLKVTKPIRDAETALEWLRSGLPIQTGISWGREMDREIVDRFTGNGGGGHSTFLWQMEGDLLVNINSWGTNWSGDGVHKWTVGAFRQMLNHRWSVFVGYAPDEMSFPDVQPIT